MALDLILTTPLMFYPGGGEALLSFCFGSLGMGTLLAHGQFLFVVFEISVDAFEFAAQILLLSLASSGEFVRQILLEGPAEQRVPGWE